MAADNKPKTITDLLIKHTKDFDGKDLSASQDLLSGLEDILREANLPDNLRQDHPELAAQQAEMMQHLVEMQTLTEQVQQAQNAGDFEAMETLSKAALTLSGMDMAPDDLPAPFDAIREAIEDGDIPALRAALGSKPDLNQTVGRYQQTPLLWAMTAERRSPAILSVLVEAGADVTFATPEGYTALHNVGDYSYRYEVTAQDDYAVAAYLVEQGADLSARNHYGWTPLDRAIIEGVPAEVFALLRVGADPNLGRIAGNSLTFDTAQTPLMSAAHDPEMVAMLLEYGADPTATGPDGQTPLDKIDTLLKNEGPDDYRPYYDGLRASRVLIAAAARPN